MRTCPHTKGQGLRKFSKELASQTSYSFLELSSHFSVFQKLFNILSASTTTLNTQIVSLTKSNHVFYNPNIKLMLVPVLSCCNKDVKSLCLKKSFQYGMNISSVTFSICLLIVFFSPTSIFSLPFPALCFPCFSKYFSNFQRGSIG